MVDRQPTGNKRVKDIVHRFKQALHCGDGRKIEDMGLLSCDVKEGNPLMHEWEREVWRERVEVRATVKIKSMKALCGGGEGAWESRDLSHL